jgi:hypothetical protein
MSQQTDRLRRIALAALGVLVAVLLTPWLAAGMANAEPEPEPSQMEPTPTEEVTTPPPPPPTTQVFIPVEGVRVTASDVELGAGYWDATATSGSFEVAVTNTGNVPEQIGGSVSVPSGVQVTGVSGGAGCASTGGQSFSCALAAGDPAGTLRVMVNVDPNAWRRAPLSGSVTARAGSASSTDGFSIVFLTSRPVPGISLIAPNVVLPPLPTPRPENVQLSVRLANTGAVWATGEIEIATPPGVDVVTFPANCLNRKRIAADRDRCAVARIEAGKDAVLVFGLAITAPARAAAPLSGAVKGLLMPTGQDTIEVVATYRIMVALSPGEVSPSAMASEEPSESPAGAGANGPSVRKGTRTLLSSQLSVVPIIGAVTGLVATVGLFVVLSLRRRLLEDGPSESSEADVVANDAPSQ